MKIALFFLLKHSVWIPYFWSQKARASGCQRLRVPAVAKFGVVSRDPMLIALSWLSHSHRLVWFYSQRLCGKTPGNFRATKYRSLQKSPDVFETNTFKEIKFYREEGFYFPLLLLQLQEVYEESIIDCISQYKTLILLKRKERKNEAIKLPSVSPWRQKLILRLF